MTDLANYFDMVLGRMIKSSQDGLILSFCHGLPWNSYHSQICFPSKFRNPVVRDPKSMLTYLTCRRHLALGCLSQLKYHKTFNMKVGSLKPLDIVFLFTYALHIASWCLMMNKIICLYCGSNKETGTVLQVFTQFLKFEVFPDRIKNWSKDRR